MTEPRRLLMWRATALASLALSAAVAVLLATHHSARPVVGPYSLPAAAAVVLAALVAAGSLVVVVLPASLLDRLSDWATHETAPFARPVPRGTRAQAIALLLMAVAAYGAIALRYAAANDMALYDQEDYLRAARQIRGAGGLPALWHRLWAGTYELNDPAAANRHPLYPALLAVRPSFETGKSLSLALGAVVVLLAGWAAARRGGGLVGGAAALLVATNGTVAESASHVACETLLMAWVMLAWIVIERMGAKARRRHTDGRPADEPAPVPLGGRSDALGPVAGSTGSGWLRCLGQCCLAGIWLGLAYLTKASALFLLVGFVLWSLGVPGLRRWGWTAVLAFIVISSPLLVRNLRAFGDPLYSFNTRFVFADTFEEAATREPRGTVTAVGQYVATHSPEQMAARAAGGLGWETFIFLRSLGPAPLGTSRALAGALIAIVVLLGGVAPPRSARWLAGLWCLGFWLFFAWYVPIASGDRFWAPVLPVLLVFAGDGAVRVIAAQPSRHPEAAGRRVLWAAAVWCALFIILTYAHTAAGLSVQS